MAKPIGPTPEVTGKDAVRILRKMNEAPHPEYKKLAEEIKSQRFVPF